MSGGPVIRAGPDLDGSRDRTRPGRPSGPDLYDRRGFLPRSAHGSAVAAEDGPSALTAGPLRWAGTVRAPPTLGWPNG